MSQRRLSSEPLEKILPSEIGKLSGKTRGFSEGLSMNVLNLRLKENEKYIFQKIRDKNS